jgi:hypothetical protein
MSQKLLRLIVALILGLACATQAGCLVVAAAAGTGAGVAYVRGDLDATVDAGPAAAADATERAFKDLELAVISKESSSLDAKIIGRTARDVKLTVVIKGESERLSRISVRTGVFGDDAMQHRVLAKIREHLGAPPANVADAKQPL